jgi:hypothetical protein
MLLQSFFSGNNFIFENPIFSTLLKQFLKIHCLGSMDFEKIPLGAHPDKITVNLYYSPPPPQHSLVDIGTGTKIRWGQ